MANLNIDRVNSSLTSAICCVPRKAESLVHAYDSADSDIDCIESELRKDYYYTSVLRDFIPPGTVTAVDTSATAVIDFSAYDFSLLTDELTGTFNITLLNGTVLQIVDISGNFSGFTSDQYLDFVTAQINTVTGWAATHAPGDLFISLSAPTSYGASINLATASLSYGSFYFIFNTYQNPTYTLVARDVINNPSSAGYGYTVSANVVYPGNYLPTLVFHHNEKPPITYTIPGLLVLNQTAMQVAYNPTTDKIYVAKVASDSTYHLYIVTLDAVGLSASSVEVVLPGTIVISNQGTAKLFNPVDNTFNVICYDTGLTQWGFLKVASDSVVTPTLNFLPCGGNEILLPVINAVTGAIAYMIGLDQLEEVSIGGTVTVIIPTGSSLSCRGISFYNQGGIWKYAFFFLPFDGINYDPLQLTFINDDYTLGLTHYFEGLYGPANQPAVTFVKELNLIHITSVSDGTFYVDIYDYSPAIPVLGLTTFFIMNPAAAARPFYSVLDNCIVWGSAFNNFGNDLFYMRLQTEGVDLSGFFYGGVDFFEWDTSNNCIDNADAIQLIERLDISCSECGSIKSSTFVRPSDIDVLFDGVDDIETGEDESILIV